MYTGLRDRDRYYRYTHIIWSLLDTEKTYFRGIQGSHREYPSLYDILNLDVLRSEIEILSSLRDREYSPSTVRVQSEYRDTYIVQDMEYSPSIQSEIWSIVRVYSPRYGV